MIKRQYISVSFTKFLKQALCRIYLRWHTSQVIGNIFHCCAFIVPDHLSSKIWPNSSQITSAWRATLKLYTSLLHLSFFKWEQSTGPYLAEESLTRTKQLLDSLGNQCSTGRETISDGISWSSLITWTLLARIAKQGWQWNVWMLWQETTFQTSLPIGH